MRAGDVDAKSGDPPAKAAGSAVPALVSWHFVGALNDFLERRRRHQRFELPLKFIKSNIPRKNTSQTPADSVFHNGQTIKDAFEAIGVPHPEVAALLVNGQPVNFSYQLAAGDSVEVFPHVSPLPVDPAWQLPFRPPGRPRFILDVHLGALVRYLRLAGFDSLYESEDLGDARIAALAETEQRILLSRDVGLLKRARVRWGYRVRSLNPREQFREVLQHFRLQDCLDPFNRCCLCNSAELVPLDRRAALQTMPEGVPTHVEELWRCAGCGKIYWQGSHYDGICKLIGSV